MAGDGRVPFEEWFDKLDAFAAVKVRRALARGSRLATWAMSNRLGKVFLKGGIPLIRAIASILAAMEIVW